MLSGFSRELAYRRSPLARRLAVLSGSALGTDLPAPRLPTPFNGLFRQPAAVPLLRPRVAPRGSNGIFTVSSIGSASRLPLRPRLTLIRLALIRKPWPSGVGVSRPHCRYLCLHLLFRTLQHLSRGVFDAGRNAPLPTPHPGGVPRLRYRAYARLLSTHRGSTSELLRTL